MLASDVIGVNMFNQKNINLSLSKALFLPKFYWQMKLTVVRLKPKVPCWKRWKKARLRWMVCVIACRNLFAVIATQNPLFQSGIFCAARITA